LPRKCPRGPAPTRVPQKVGNRLLSSPTPIVVDSTRVHRLTLDLPSMFKMNAGYFLMQLSSEKDKEHVYKLCGQHSRADANGVAQVCFIGVINPQNPRVESPEEVRDALMEA